MDSFEKPVYDGQRYANPKSFINWTGLPSFRELLRWKCLEPRESIPSKQVLENTLPVEKPKFDLSSKLSATWLGHATVFVRLDGISFITDPVWKLRASPLRFFGPKRYRPSPCTIAELPELNFGVISHNHYDHLDAQAVKELSIRFPEMEWFVPKGLKSWMQSCTQGNIVHEMSWGEHMTVPMNEGKFQIWCIPAQHWSSRFLFDRNKSLWSGFAVVGNEHKFYYTGDTGFCEQEFAKLGHKLGPFDLAAVPIGCYSPRWFMKPQHIDPSEAVQIHILTKSVRTLGIHWGTYKMGSTEHYLEPRSKLREAANDKGYSLDEIFTLNHGGVWSIENDADVITRSEETISTANEGSQIN